MKIEILHTSQLTNQMREEIKAMLWVTYEGDFADSDWSHTIGGMHILARTERLVGHASVIQRQLLHQKRALRAGYVEAVAVLPEYQRKGIGAALMHEAEEIIRSSYELGMLGASEEGLRLYQQRGWLPWRGRAFAFTPEGIIRTQEDEDCLYYMPVSVQIDPTQDITCEYREGDVW
jgi:aminoglycoside 2'-N-acetyltransferase I